MYNNWNEINWEQVEATVFNIQHQIYLASKANNFSAVRNLQNMLLNMYEPRLLAVKTITTNSGGKTPGIDQWIALNDDDKFKVANSIVLDGKADLVRRVYVPKPGTSEKRPLDIPTITDRAKQCFVKFIIEPEFEAKFEGNSFGFRPGRSPIDAISKIRAHLIFHGPCYVLETDIKKCFDTINHAQLLNKMQTLQPIGLQVHAWLIAGILDEKEIIFPSQGTPQGGIISPLLANIAIDGLQWAISQAIQTQYPSQLKHVYYIRYADDLVCFAPTLEAINCVTQTIANYLAPMGLEMKKEKTRIIYTLTKIDENKYASNHFDFLGFRFKQRIISKHAKQLQNLKMPINTYVIVSPNRIQRHKASISSLIRELGSTNVRKLIEQLNPRIRGWSNYFRNSDAKQYGDLPRKMDLWLNAKIRKWIRKSSKKRGKSETYWKQDNKDWILFHKDDQGNEITLEKYKSQRWAVYNYKAVNANFSPYELEYKRYKQMTKGQIN